VDCKNKTREWRIRRKNEGERERERERERAVGKNGTNGNKLDER
jgi:hypothetical protein